MSTIFNALFRQTNRKHVLQSQLANSMV